jgi:hypothetical protein
MTPQMQNAALQIVKISRTYNYHWALKGYLGTRRLGGRQKVSGHSGGKAKNPKPTPAGNRTPVFRPVARNDSVWASSRLEETISTDWVTVPACINRLGNSPGKHRG